MSQKRDIEAADAEKWVNWATLLLIRRVEVFNEEHPDQDAESVSSHFDYLTDNYVRQTCASVLAKSHFIIPPEGATTAVAGEAVDDAASEDERVRLGEGEETSDAG